MRKKRAAALAAATVATATLQACEAPPVRHFTASAEQIEAVRQTFDTARAYWVAHGVPAMRDVRLKVLSGNDNFNCYGVQAVTSASSAEYCAAGEGTVLITARDIQSDSTALRQVLTVAHELGHGVQDKTDQLSIIDTRPIELGATCLAGQMMRDEFALLTMGSLTLGVLDRKDYFNIGDDQLHGAHQQQEAAFMQGFTQQGCAPYTQHPLVHL